MDLTEHQGKQLYRQYKLPVAGGITISDVRAAKSAFEHLRAERPKIKKVVLKAQIPIGHRGQNGAILFATDKDVESKAAELLGKIVEGHEIKQLLIEEFIEIKQELYLALMLDRQAREVVVLFSPQGGMEIEELTKKGGLVRASLPLNNEEWSSLKKQLPSQVHDQFTNIVQELERLMSEKDATLVEVNPLAITEDNELMLLDSKVVIDDNALFRQTEFSNLVKTDTEVEKLAKEKGLAFVPLDGTIAVIGNGAGLVMATLDLLQREGGSPANFLDVGGGAKQGVMESALDLVLRQKQVKGLFVNIFGGITRADEIASGLVEYLKDQDVNIPIVVRLIGNNEEQGKKILNSAGIDALDSMEEAAKLIVEKTK